MARQLNPEKHKALLDAAIILIAERGPDVSTAAIAKQAGVAEGTLFTYFATKSQLLNHLYLFLSQSLADSLFSLPPESKTAEARMRNLWDGLIDWGLDNRASYKAKHQLRISAHISIATHCSGAAIFQKLLERVEEDIAEQAKPKLRSFYINSVIPGLTDIAIDAIISEPKRRAELKRASFDLFWQGIRD